MSQNTLDQKLLDFADQAMRIAKKQGAEYSEVIARQDSGYAVRIRNQVITIQEHYQTTQIALRILSSGRQAVISTNYPDPASLEDWVGRGVALAAHSPPDPLLSPTPAESLVKNWPELDLCDEELLSFEDMLERTRVAENAALAVPHITQAEESEGSACLSRHLYCSSAGFSAQFHKTIHQIYVGVLAKKAEAMVRDHAFATRRFSADLPNAEKLGKLAGERCAARIDARKIRTGKMPVIFDERVAHSLLGHFLAAINGRSVARGLSFLQHDLHKKIFPEVVQIINDPTEKRSLRGRPFDGEFCSVAQRSLVQDGVLTGWLLDRYAAAQLKCEPSHDAVRSNGLPTPSAANAYFLPGEQSCADMITDTQTGLYVTGLMGQQINMVSGDYSRGATGFLIEKGKVSHPVHEITIAGNLRDMFAHLSIANHLPREHGIDSPALAIPDMVVAGN